MANYAEYTTIQDLRATWQGSTATTEDTLILQMIRGVSRDMEIGSRWFYPRIETHYYDTPSGRELYLEEEDYLAISSVVNGDGTTVSSSDYHTLPYNQTQKHTIRLTIPSGLSWLPSTDGSTERAISVTGVVGYSRDYGSAWQLSSVTIQNNPLSSSGTSITASAGSVIYAGMLLRLGTTNDYAYVTTVSGTTVTVVRSVNGSTGTSHTQGESIYIWTPGFELETLCKAATQARLRLKESPVGESVQIAGSTFSTPKDVTQYIHKQLQALGYTRSY